LVFLTIRYLYQIKYIILKKKNQLARHYFLKIIFNNFPTFKKQSSNHKQGRYRGGDPSLFTVYWVLILLLILRVFLYAASY